MARSRSLSRDRRDRKRDRSKSPRDSRKEKRSRRSPSRDRRRSRSPRKGRDDRSPKRDSKKSRHSSPPKEHRRRSRTPKVNGKEEEGELVVPRENGANHRDRKRSRSRESKRSKSRDRRRSKSRERVRSRSRDRRRSKSADKNRLSHEDVKSNGVSKASQQIEAALAEPAKQAEPDKKAEPVSLEEFLKKKKQEEEQAAKPKFLSKKQREELALQRLKEESEAKKQRQEELRGSQDPYKSISERQHEERKREDRRKLDEDRQRLKEEREREKELELIKKQYLGEEKVKKKIRKPSEKFHLNFDWETNDDTSRDLNPIYNNTHEAALLFGSGKRAGVDMQEQKKLAAEHQRQLLKKLREAQGLKETKQDRERDRERKRLAESYDGLDTRNVVKEHWSQKKRDEMTERDWRIFREDFNIAYKGINVSGTALPIRNWEEAALPATLMKAIHELNYKKPSPIQMASIPLGMMQRDIIGVAETGSGKTAAFVLPMLCYLMKQPEMTEEVAAEGPYAVIMAPVRELAQQIEEETMKLAKFTPYRTVSVVGGQDINDQAFKLRKGCEIVIATPGRLKDCVEQSFAVLNQCNYVVLDEADRMIDMGFEPQVVGVLDAMPSSNLKPEEEDGVLEEDRVYRTTYMFSATMPPPVERLARKYMRRPVVINIGSAGKATDNVTQKVYMLKENEKLGILEQELELVNEKRAIVFVNTKRSCDIVSRHLDNLEYRCTILHGGKTQDQREASLAGFREEKYNVLVATDVAGRGIDVPDVALVINYDMPAQIEQYTHRIGRTARAGRKGQAVTLLTPSDTEVYYDLKKLLEESGAPVPSQLAHHEAARTKPGTVVRETTVYAKK